MCHFWLSTRICLRLTLCELLFFFIDLANFKEKNFFWYPYEHSESQPNLSHLLSENGWLGCTSTYWLSKENGLWNEIWSRELMYAHLLIQFIVFINLKFMSTTHIFYIFFFSFLQRNIFVPKMGCFENLTSGRQSIQSLTLFLWKINE